MTVRCVIECVTSVTQHTKWRDVFTLAPWSSTCCAQAAHKRAASALGMEDEKQRKIRHFQAFKAPEILLGLKGTPPLTSCFAEERIF